MNARMSARLQIFDGEEKVNFLACVTRKLKEKGIFNSEHEYKNNKRVAGMEPITNPRYVREANANSSSQSSSKP